MKQTIMAFSIGLLTATGIFTLVYLIEDRPQENTANDSTLSVEDVEAYAENHQLKVLTDDDYQQLINENEEMKNQIEQQEIAENEDEAEQEDTGTSENEDESGENVYHYVLQIESGMNSSDIADLLESNQVIEDASSFIEYLQENDLSQTIQLGSYEVTSTMSIEEIAQMITR